MNFRPSESIDRARFPNTARQWESEPAGRWWIHANAMIYGVRVCVGLSDAGEPSGRSSGYEAVYCCGADPVLLLLVMGAVTRALEAVPETAAADDVARRMPRQARKPMNNGPGCWARLCELAGVEAPPLVPDAGMGADR
jgi:hypothetical protein